MKKKLVFLMIIIFFFICFSREIFYEIDKIYFNDLRDSNFNIGVSENTVNITNTILSPQSNILLDPTVILVPNATNKAYKRTTSSACSWGNALTEEFEDGNYSKINVSDDNWYTQVLTNTKSSTICSYYKFTFNLTSFGISLNQLTDAVMLHEGQTPLLGMGNVTFYFFNVTSGTWTYISTIISLEETDVNNTKEFTSNFGDILNTTSGLLQFGIRIAQVGIGTATSYTDYVHLNVSYTGGDTTSPTYSNIFSNITNNTAVSVGTPIGLGAQWSDNVALSMYLNSSKINDSGSWTNGTWQNFAAGNWSNFTIIFPSEQGSNLTVKIYANDTSNNQNVTGTWFWWNTTAVDNTAPTFSNPGLNTTCSGKIANFSTVISDDVALSGYIFSTNNTGTWVNYTWASLSSGGTAVNVTTLNSTVGTRVNYTWYANDTSNNWAVLYNSTQTTDCDSPTYSQNSTNSTTAGAPVLQSLNWTDNAGLSGYIFSFDNCTGSLSNDTWVSMTGATNWSNLTKTINSTTSCTVRWCIYANDTSNNWNGTSCSVPFSYDTTSAGTFISISVSQAILDGIMFETIDPDTDDNEAVNNSNGPDGGTAYNITIDPSTTVNVDLYHDTTGDLESGSYVILIGNVTHNANTTSNAGENLISSGSVALDAAYSTIGNTVCQSLGAGSDCWIRYWLDVPSNQPPGDYTTTYEYCAVETGIGSAQCE